MQIALVLKEIHMSPRLLRGVVRLELPADSQYFILKKELGTPCEINPYVQFSLSLVKLHPFDKPRQINHESLAEQLLGRKHLTWVL
jgi:hypothetical protein